MSKLIFSGPVGLEEIENNSFKVYPNPANDRFTLLVDESILGGEIDISDIQGRKLTKANIISTQQELLIPQLNSGVYFITVRKNGLKNIKRLLVNK